MRLTGFSNSASKGFTERLLTTNTLFALGFWLAYKTSESRDFKCKDKTVMTNWFSQGCWSIFITLWSYQFSAYLKRWYLKWVIVWNIYKSHSYVSSNFLTIESFNIRISSSLLFPRSGRPCFWENKIFWTKLYKINW